MFRAHYAERFLASTRGVFCNIPDRGVFFRQVSTMIPQGWTPGTEDMTWGIEAARAAHPNA
jgi:alpha-N-arabinofuranosidase